MFDKIVEIWGQPHGQIWSGIPTASIPMYIVVFLRSVRSPIKCEDKRFHYNIVLVGVRVISGIGGAFPDSGLDCQNCMWTTGLHESHIIIFGGTVSIEDKLLALLIWGLYKGN